MKGVNCELGVYGHIVDLLTVVLAVDVQAMMSFLKSYEKSLGIKITCSEVGLLLFRSLHCNILRYCLDPHFA